VSKSSTGRAAAIARPTFPVDFAGCVVGADARYCRVQFATSPRLRLAHLRLDFV
jgi:hypothetical protein